MIHSCTITRRRAVVLSTALVTGALGCREDASSPASPELGPALEIESAAALSFRQVSAAGRHTCGVTTSNLAYCWGDNRNGQLGDGRQNIRLKPTAVVGPS
jgi:alpha-tubulin suppressor-like RCC1 family protein